VRRIGVTDWARRGAGSWEFGTGQQENIMSLTSGPQWLWMSRFPFRPSLFFPFTSTPPPPPAPHLAGGGGFRFVRRGRCLMSEAASARTVPRGRWRRNAVVIAAAAAAVHPPPHRSAMRHQIVSALVRIPVFPFDYKFCVSVLLNPEKQMRHASCAKLQVLFTCPKSNS
jgi:hypothetical protein